VVAVEVVSSPRPLRTPRRVPGLQVELVEALEPLCDEWIALGHRGENVFGTWEWNSLWWDHFGRGRRLMTAACRSEAGGLVGLLPMYLVAARGPLRMLRMLGHGQSDRLGPICLPPDRPAVAHALQVALRSKPWRNALILLEQIPVEERWSTLLGGRAVASGSSPVLELNTRDWEEFLRGRSTHLRREFRRKQRRLEREHAVRYRLVDDPEALPEALDVLFDLHRRRWGDQAAREFAGTEAFHREFAARALERGWLRLWLMELEGRPVAAWYGFRFGGADWYYQAGRDPAWDRYSVGTVLFGHTIRGCIDAGLERFMFLRGDEPYKRRFATGDPGLETVALATGVLGGAALRAADVMPISARRRAARMLGI
jgi:CelD/BcsL family acetyltransferase involved in cellulose biosynthesis